MGFFYLFILMFPAAACIAAFLSGPAYGEGCVTDACHSTLLKTANIHPVTESCDNCHQAGATAHPQKNKKTFTLTQGVPDLCYMCHSPFGKKQVVHPPIAGGMCTGCHDPHGSEEPKLLMLPIYEICLTCHPDKTSQSVVHGPTATGECTACHDPHESDNRALTKKDGAELCTTCHSDIQEELKRNVVHPAIYGGCTSCHNPHSSPYRKMLSAEGEKLCFLCHPKISEKTEKAKSVHPPIKTEKACASCHFPHAGDSEKLLPKAGKELCLDCHKGFIKKNQTVLHGPIRDGKCTPCHDPHGSANIKLLVKEFPADIYPAYKEDEYELCFSCHNRELLKYPDTSFSTGFRDGERNLHYLHVNRTKSRNCKLCHIIHAGDLPKLIAGRAPFGNWNIPLNFEKWDTGGSCLPGCHKKVVYDRVTPGKAPETEKSKEDKKNISPGKGPGTPRTGEGKGERVALVGPELTGPERPAPKKVREQVLP